jgi:Tol biopolymer transport system component
VRNIIKLCVLMTIFIFLILESSQKEIKYYSSPYVVTFQETIDSVEIGDYQLSVVDGELIIEAKNKKFEISLPDKLGNIQSFHFSYDKRFLAYDVMVESGIKIFVVNLETGEKINLSETIGDLYDYDGYQSPFGIVWAPDKNLIAFIGGYNDSARIGIYHFEMEKSKQASRGSSIFKDVYGVKWDSTGESIYYLVDSFEDENMYQLYQTEVETNSYLRAGTVNVIAEINKDGFNNWLNNEE